jgi:hypothetical protein
MINNDYIHTTNVWNCERGVFLHILQNGCIPSCNYPIQDRSQLFSLVWNYIQSKQGYAVSTPIATILRSKLTFLLWAKLEAMNWQHIHSLAIWLLYCIPEHREEKRVAPETYQKPIVEEGLPPVIHQTTASYAPRTQASFNNLQLRYTKYRYEKGNDVALQI